MIRRFKVARCTTVEDEEGAVYTLLLEPYWPAFEGDSDSPVDDLLYDVKCEHESPCDFEILTLTKGDRVEGVEISYPEPVKPGTLVDMELHLLATVSE